MPSHLFATLDSLLASLADRIIAFLQSRQFAKAISAISRFLRRPRNFLITISIFTLLWLATCYLLRDYLAPDIVARVLFAETANCSPEERLLVAGVMNNRIGNPAFGSPATLDDVARQPGAFSCLDDPDNDQWQKSLLPSLLTPAEKVVWQDCLRDASAFLPHPTGPSGRPLVFYHDKSISMPTAWTSPAWQTIREKAADHFIFYSIRPTSQSQR